jgi:hypothetical protein
MKKQVLSGLSALALLAGAGVALAQEKGPAAPSAAPGANSGNSGANMDKGAGKPGASERSAPAASEHGASSGKSEAARQLPEKGADKGADKALGHDKAQMQASEKDQRGTSTAKKDPDSSKDRAAKDGKESSSGAASGEAGKANATAEGRDDRSSTRSHVSLKGEQRTRVQSAFKSHRGSAKADVNIQVRVGVAVPRTVTLYEVPEDVVIIVPEWRRYKYVLIGDEICIIDPDTYEIIDVVAAV